MPITIPPNPMPARSLEQDDFDAAMAQLMIFIPTMVTNANALEANVISRSANCDAKSTAADASANAALASQNAAAAIANTAAASAGATAWNAGTAYTIGQRAIDPGNQRVYFRKIAGTTATQPSADTTNWAITPGQFVDDPITSGTTAQCSVWVNTQLRNTGAAMTAAVPAGMQHKERFKLSVQNGRTDNVLTLGSYLAKGPSGLVYDTSILFNLPCSAEFVYDAANNTLYWE